ncbi:tumor necrosis factor receptor superfamily member 23-like isoform X2 [Artibeus jamaicensis]|uniref:tumor necrosis factor receptor superfamily member 23-like isoform X2 n=1 Tax=Artibeus jamaicensis TaxID=9417 RepID=UPI00235B2662|nr:tumor necrosis factor receptor superfamily member 23-like isoform X2 [Artibeus jamaicensis]
MALASALLSLSQSLLLPLLLREQFQLVETAPTLSTSQRSPGRPGPTDQCGPHEYWSTGHCCQLCPAGEYVREHCRRPHTRGQCEKCDRGTFTASPNGLESCLLCGTCSNEQVEVVECNATSDRMCRCQPGRFYKTPGEEEFCRRCSTCPEGLVVLQQCNSTADTVCGPPGPESRHRLSLIGSFIILSLVCLGIYITAYVKKVKDGGFQSWSSGSSDLEPLEETSCDHTLLPVSTGTRDRGGSLGPESSVSSESSHGTREADPPGPRTDDHGLSAGSLGLASVAPMPPSIPESLAGVGGPQAAAV